MELCRDLHTCIDFTTEKDHIAMVYIVTNFAIDMLMSSDRASFFISVVAMKSSQCTTLYTFVN